MPTVRIENALIRAAVQIVQSGEASDLLGRIKAAIHSRMEKAHPDTVTGMHQLAKVLLDIKAPDRTVEKTSPKNATLLDWKSGPTQEFLREKMPDGTYDDQKDLLNWAKEWNGIEVNGRTRAVTHGYFLQKNLWTLKPVFSTTSLKNMLGQLGYKKKLRKESSTKNYAGSSRIFKKGGNIPGGEDYRETKPNLPPGITKICQKMGGEKAELRLPIGTREAIIAFFRRDVTKNGGTLPTWQAFLAPILDEESDVTALQNVSRRLNEGYEASEERGFFLPSTLESYSMILFPQKTNGSATLKDIIETIAGRKIPKKPTAKKTSALQSGASHVVGDILVGMKLTESDKKARIATAKTLFRRDIGLLSGIDTSTMLEDATYEIDGSERKIALAYSSQEANSKDIQEIWRKVLTPGNIGVLKLKGYIYHEKYKFLMISTGGWSYGLLIPQISTPPQRGSYKPGDPTRPHADNSNRAYNESIRARREFSDIINNALGIYYTRLLQNNIANIKRDCLRINFEEGFTTDVDINKKVLVIHYNRGHSADLNIAKEVLQTLDASAFRGCEVNSERGDKRVIRYPAQNDWTVELRLSN